MKYMAKGVRLIQLALFLFIAAHTHQAMAYEVILVNLTPNSYTVEFTWAQKAGQQYSDSFFCRPNTTCNKKPFSNDDPYEHDYVAPRLTGEFTISQKSIKGNKIVSRRSQNPESDRTYRCLIKAYMQEGKAIFTYSDNP